MRPRQAREHLCPRDRIEIVELRTDLALGRLDLLRALREPCARVEDAAGDGPAGAEVAELRRVEGESEGASTPPLLTARAKLSGSRSVRTGRLASSVTRPTLPGLASPRVTPNA
jgi:hypothetical protein